MNQSLGATTKRAYKKEMNKRRVSNITYQPTPTEAIVQFTKCIRQLSKETIVNAWRAVLGGIPGRDGVVLTMDDTPRVTNIDVPHDELHDDRGIDEEEEQPPLPTRYVCSICERSFWLATNEDSNLIQFCIFCGENII